MLIVTTCLACLAFGPGRAGLPNDAPDKEHEFITLTLTHATEDGADVEQPHESLERVVLKTMFDGTRLRWSDGNDAPIRLSSVFELVEEEPLTPEALAELRARIDEASESWGVGRDRPHSDFIPIRAGRYDLTDEGIAPGHFVVDGGTLEVANDRMSAHLVISVDDHVAAFDYELGDSSFQSQAVDCTVANRRERPPPWMPAGFALLVVLGRRRRE
ncbi:MAG: hypothetical protein AAF721_06960 [Myxococcota bacterium]